MEVILLERVSRLGQMGETVRVKDGFARNFLLPQGKALRANEANKKKFESQRSTLEARNNERKADALKIANKVVELAKEKGLTMRQAAHWIGVGRV